MRNHDALLGYIADRETMPFAWGARANDCVAFAAGAVRAQTGVNLLKGLRWTTATGAMRAAHRRGGLVAAVSHVLDPVAPASAHRGDVAGVDDPDFPGGVALMIVEGETLVGPGDLGNRRLPRSAMIRAWSAGTINHG